MKAITIILSTLIFTSCVAYNKNEDSQFALAMDEYYYNHMCYPTEIEEYLYQSYRDDSVCGFEGLKYEMQFHGIRPDDLDAALYDYLMSCVDDTGTVHKPIEYEKYNEIRSIANTKHKDEMPASVWYLIYSGKGTASFEEDDSAFYFVDETEKTKYYCEKVDKLLLEYISNYEKWNEEYQPFYAEEESMYLKVNRAQRIGDIYIYRKNADGTLMNIGKENVRRDLLDNLIEAIDETGERLQPNSPHFLQYDKSSGITHYAQKEKVPEVIVKNTKLKNSLSSIIDATGATFIRFECSSKQ